jgi:hypothetical protein
MSGDGILAKAPKMTAKVNKTKHMEQLYNMVAETLKELQGDRFAYSLADPLTIKVTPHSPQLKVIAVTVSPCGDFS